MSFENFYRDLLNERKNGFTEKMSFLRFAAVLLAVCLCLTITFINLLNVVIVDGSSMQPTLQDGDYLFIYKTQSIERGDIVVYERETYDKNNNLVIVPVIKRVIAVEGDVIFTMQEDGKTVLYRQNAGEAQASVVDEPYLKENWEKNTVIKRMVIPEGEFFAMGDNRNISYDCRDYGSVSLSTIDGVVTSCSIKMKKFVTGFFNIFNVFNIRKTEA